MKKSLIPAFLIIGAFAGCKGAHIESNTPSSTTIMPAAANNSQSMTVTMTPGSASPANNVMVSVYFMAAGGSNPPLQTITVGANPPLDVFASNALTPNTWNSFSIPGTMNQKTYSITATIAGETYGVTSAPTGPGVNNPYGAAVSTYGDGAGNSAIVIVQDVAVVNSH